MGEGHYRSFFPCPLFRDKEKRKPWERYSHKEKGEKSQQGELSLKGEEKTEIRPLLFHPDARRGGGRGCFRFADPQRKEKPDEKGGGGKATSTTGVDHGGEKKKKGGAVVCPQSDLRKGKGERADPLGEKERKNQQRRNLRRCRGEKKRKEDKTRPCHRPHSRGGGKKGSKRAGAEKKASQALSSKRRGRQISKKKKKKAESRKKGLASDEFF